MPTDYYARRNGTIIGPFHAYDQVVGYHAKQARHHQPRADDMAVLLNLGTLTLTPDELQRILKYDPVLKAIYELGRQAERHGHADNHELAATHAPPINRQLGDRHDPLWQA